SKVVLVGHSQGGHAVLAAQALAHDPEFGIVGDLVGVAAYAPFWLSLAAYGAQATSLAALFGYTTAKTPRAILYSMEYFYSAAELLDGPGHGLDPFQPAQRAGVRQVLTGGVCNDEVGLQGLGATAYDIFDHTFADDVGGTCALTGICASPLATTWLTRWRN